MIFYATGNGKFHVLHDHVKSLGQEQKNVMKSKRDITLERIAEIVFH